MQFSNHMMLTDGLAELYETDEATLRDRIKALAEVILDDDYSLEEVLRNIENHDAFLANPRK